MKPWEIDRTKKKLNKLTGEKALKLFFGLYRAAYDILRASLKNDRPNLTRRQLKNKINLLADTLGPL